MTTPGVIVILAIRLLDSGMVSQLPSDLHSKRAHADHTLGIPKVMASSRTIATEIVSSTPTQLAFKMQQEYTPRVVHFSKKVNSLVTLTLDESEKVRYHKDMWNEKDYSHQGLGKMMKTLNGDHLTKITRPPGDL